MKQEHEKTAIITGSGRGIGKETVVILAKKGCQCSCYPPGLKVKLIQL